MALSKNFAPCQILYTLPAFHFFLDPLFYLRYRILEPCNVLLIRPNGDVKLDCVLPFKIGNVMNDSINNMWEIGKTAWRNEQVLKYIGSLKEERDMLRVHPIPYIDEDVLIR